MLFLPPFPFSRIHYKDLGAWLKRDGHCHWCSELGVCETLYASLSYHTPLVQSVSPSAISLAFSHITLLIIHTVHSTGPHSFRDDSLVLERRKLSLHHEQIQVINTTMVIKKKKWPNCMSGFIWLIIKVEMFGYLFACGKRKKTLEQCQGKPQDKSTELLYFLPATLKEWLCDPIGKSDTGLSWQSGSVCLLQAR